MPSTLSLAIVGIDYPNKRGPGRRFAIELCKPGDLVQLVPEPKNKADPRAVAVFNREGMQMGYLTAERCRMIGRIISEGTEVRAVFQALLQHSAVIRVAFDGGDPVLPPDAGKLAKPAAGDDGFYPDEVWPDE